MDITLPAETIDYLITWAEIGQERVDVDPEHSARLGEIIRQVRALPIKGDLAAAERIGGSVVNPKWTRMVAAFVERHRAFHGSDWTHDDADGFLKWAKRTNRDLFWFYTRDLGVPVP